MTDTTSPFLTDPGPPPSAPAGMPHPENRFFAWIRSLGIPRTRGWLGGVCSGIAARIGIDPLIVRGIFVVAALIGFPALLIYAIAWALLPDLNGRIPLQQLGRGVFEPSLVAIAIMALVSFVPVVPWMWAVLGWPFQYMGDGAWSTMGWAVSGPIAVLNTLFTVLAVLGAIGLVVWLVVRAAKTPRGGTVLDPQTASADPAAPGPFPDTEAGPAAAWVAESVPVAAPLPVAEPSAPVAAPTDASADELAAWRVRHEAWRVEHEAWRRQQADADAAAREQSRRERETASAAFAAESAERRRVRRATKPRASAVAVLAIVGTALITGALTTLVVAEPAGVVSAATAGLLAAAIVCATGMVVVGLLRRRSGFLAFVTILFLGVGVITGVTTTTSTLLWPGASLSTVSTADQRFIQPFGDTSISISPLSDENITTGAIVLRKGTGPTTIEVWPGTELDLDARLANSGTVSFTRVDFNDGAAISDGDVAPDRLEDGLRSYSWQMPNRRGDESLTTVPITIEQAGNVHVIIYEQ
ncbi:hypothetical protein ASD65_16230 [Microbacterium sp. Root61]|uniref:PspC domain-containing protein n=1 Tax=Microbacterium sp. Root61 TaxID=1736570 RepID=UPI0006FE53CA|nr:PspC domain-containing protein [Microbacterium sp. Root61]KRA25799.1 hypothetical protein ASD65_16230 [Microbacterium sp. Root61]